MRPIDTIVVHGAATPPGMDIGVEEIRRWHTDPKPRGRGWTDVGYHLAIRRDGTVELGRPFVRPGAHVAGHNANSIGVCLVGSGLRDGLRGPAQPNYTQKQYASLRIVLTILKAVFGLASVVGHSDLFPGKPYCPGFDVGDFLSGG